VSSASELLEIVNTEHIHLELTVFEKDILTIKKDQKITFKVPEASNKSFEAEVHLVGTSINENRTITVHGHINNEENTNFIVGMFVEADITIHSDKGSGLPLEAIIKAEDGVYALSLVERAEDQYYFEKVALNIGRQTESFVEILNTDALQGKQIVIKGTSMIQ
jgi:cobalt-zinc-cadmium efflux system membrane fusion protein